MFAAKETIRKRRSVRSFNGSPLREADKKAIEAYLDELKNPFGVPVFFRLLEAKAYGLSSPVIVGEDTYLAAKVSTKQKYFMRTKR